MANKKGLKKNEIFTSFVDDEYSYLEIIDFIMNNLTIKWNTYDFLIPFEEVAKFRKCSYVLKEEIKENGILYTARINPINFDYYSKYLFSD